MSSAATSNAPATDAPSAAEPASGDTFEKVAISARKPYSRTSNVSQHGQADMVPMPDFRIALGKGESTLEGDQGFKKIVAEKTKTNPLVPLGMLATTGALVFGLRAFMRGDRQTSQLMMRYRVGFQFFTIMAIAGGLAISSYQSGADDKTKDH